jgi:hypothetical protein
MTRRLLQQEADVIAYPRPLDREGTMMKFLPRWNKPVSAMWFSVVATFVKFADHQRKAAMLKWQAQTAG